jgi:hypothetical protein
MTTFAFQHTLKTANPRLAFHKHKLEAITYASTQCTEITGPTGLLAWLLSPAEWAAVPGNSVANAAGVIVVAPIFDILTPLDVPALNAPNAAVKIYEMNRSDRHLVKQGIQALKILLLGITPQSDISEQGHPVLGMFSVTPAQMFAHSHGNYGVLNQEDFNVIFSLLQAPKLPTQDYATLGEIHRDLHTLLAGAGQPQTELTKTTLLTEALKDDYAGKEAIRLFVQTHPAMLDRIFEDMVQAIILHAPTITPTTSSLGYANSLLTNSTPLAVPAYAASSLDELGMAQLISKTQKDLAALKRRNGTTPAPTVRSPPTTPLLYCYKHGYQHTHAGKDCKLMQSNPLVYQGPQLNAKDPHNPTGGNTSSRG